MGVDNNCIDGKGKITGVITSRMNYAGIFSYCYRMHISLCNEIVLMSVGPNAGSLHSALMSAFSPSSVVHNHDQH